MEHWARDRAKGQVVMWLSECAQVSFRHEVASRLLRIACASLVATEELASRERMSLSL